MKHSLQINGIHFTDDGKRITYDYSLSPGLKKYFRKDNTFFVAYEEPVDHLPHACTIIPLLCNLMPFAWFLDIEIIVQEVETSFIKSLEKIKSDFSETYPDYPLGGGLTYETEISIPVEGNEHGMLFSGGMDTYHTYTRVAHTLPRLYSVWGADVALDDHQRWNAFKALNEAEDMLKNNSFHYIKTNCRDFYTEAANEIVQRDWWGAVQHGMCLLGILAPLSYIHGVNHLYIASSGHEGVSYPWGSKPGIDENLSWGGVAITHEGYENSRVEKAAHLIRYAKENEVQWTLRVCYAEERSTANCNRCHKCLRTLLSIWLFGGKPEDFGMAFPKDFGRMVQGNLYPGMDLTVGILYQWQGLQDLLKNSWDILDFSPFTESDKAGLRYFRDLDLEALNKKRSWTRQVKKQLKKFLLATAPFLLKWKNDKVNYGTN